MIFTPPETKTYEEEVQWRAKAGMKGKPPSKKPIHIEILAYRPIPESKPEKWKRMAESGHIMPTTTPDLDNYFKAIADGCNGIVWEDDCQITSMLCRKFYSNIPRVQVTIAELDGFAAQEKPKEQESFLENHAL